MCLPMKESKTGETDGEEQEEKPEAAEIPVDMYYDYEKICSRPVITTDSDIPENLLHLSYPSVAWTSGDDHDITENMKSDKISHADVFMCLG